MIFLSKGNCSDNSAKEMVVELKTSGEVIKTLEFGGYVVESLKGREPSSHLTFPQQRKIYIRIRMTQSVKPFGF